MSGVMVVDAESFRSTCFGRDAYIHHHCLDILITMLNSVNCSTVICSPTVEYLCSRENPLVKPMAPGSILIISIYITLVTCFVFIFPLLFTLHLSIKNTKNIISIRSHSRKWPWRDWQPLSLGCKLLSFCVGTRDLCVVSYWIDTLVLKNWGKYLRYFTASAFPLWGNPTQCSRASTNHREELL